MCKNSTDWSCLPGFSHISSLWGEEIFDERSCSFCCARAGLAGAGVMDVSAGRDEDGAAVASEFGLRMV